MKAKALLVDYMYMLRGQIRSVRNLPIPSTWRTASGNRHIILIAGVYERWHFLRDIGDALVASGYQVHIVPSINRNRQPLKAEAAKLHDYLQVHSIENAVIIGHSKGGLVGLRYLIDHGAENRISKLIAIATPFSGTTIGRLIRLRVVRELLPDSPHIVQLRDFVDKKRLVSIFPIYDNHIWHPDGSRVKGATNIQLKARGHHAILFKDELYQHILREVKDIQ